MDSGKQNQTIPRSSLKRFHAALHAWYGRYGRHDLPWRNTDDAYRIYISEIMLQQTQVKTVLERFYSPFLEKFPSLSALASAPRAEVLKQWEGLGYYNRAANLHEAAMRAAPQLPRSVEALEALPGIGRNTAHAVAAFAYHQPVPVMEANVKRVLCRVFALKTPSVNVLWEKAFALLDKQNPYDYNQAMMDIGAMVCTKRAPKCIECPANDLCEGKETPEAFPSAVSKKAVPVREVNVVVWEDARGRVHLTPREGAFLRGLYGFDNFPPEQETIYFQNKAYPLLKQDSIGEVSQTYSHFIQQAAIWHICVDEVMEGEGWFLREEIAGLALSGIDHKILALFARNM